MRRERAAAAQQLLSNSVFESIRKELWDEAMEELMVSEPGSLPASSAHARLRAIADVHLRISAAANDSKFI